MYWWFQKNGTLDDETQGKMDKAHCLEATPFLRQAQIGVNLACLGEMSKILLFSFRLRHPII